MADATTPAELVSVHGKQWRERTQAHCVVAPARACARVCGHVARMKTRAPADWRNACVRQCYGYPIGSTSYLVVLELKFLVEFNTEQANGSPQNRSKLLPQVSMNAN